MKYFEFFKLLEKKDHIIKKMNHLTDEQKQIAIDFFTKHPSYESELGTKWNSPNLSWEDLEKVIYKPRTSKSQIKKVVKKGIEGIEEGKDYLLLGEGIFHNSPFQMYQPLTWAGSRVLASNKVLPNVETDSRNERYSGAAWCISYQKDRSYWEKYLDKGNVFLFVFGESIPTHKVAIQIKKTINATKQPLNNEAQERVVSYTLECWDAFDERFCIVTQSFPEALNLSFKEALLMGVSNKTSDIKVSSEAQNFLKYFPTEVLDAIDVVTSNITLVNQESDKESDLLVESELRILLERSNYDTTGVLNIPRNLSDKYTHYHEDVERYFVRNGKFRYTFGKVDGDFNCAGIESLTSLEGCPREITGDFIISDTRNLKSLKGCPEKVGGDFEAKRVTLKELDDFPKYVGNLVNLDWSQIESLKGMEHTNIVDGIHIMEVPIKNLEGIPSNFKGSIFARDCFILESLKGCPRVLTYLDLEGCENLKSLEYKPKKVYNYVDIEHCTGLKDLWPEYKTEVSSIYFNSDLLEMEEVKEAFDAEDERYFDSNSSYDF